MPHSGENIRLQVLVNGTPRCIGGLESFGVLAAGLDWVRRDPARAPTGKGAPELQEWIANRAIFRLGGVDSDTEVHLHWLQLDLQPGDEITLRVLPPGDFDSPSWTASSDADNRRLNANGPRRKKTPRRPKPDKEP